MENKQMIEEMARIIAFVLCPNRNLHIRWGDKAQCYSDNNFAECTQIKNVVDKLYNAGYRKIPENAVVLNREKYEWLTCCFGKFEEIMNDIKEQSRKETAEKFAERLKEKAHWFLNNEIQKDHFCECLDEICKGIIGEEK